LPLPILLVEKRHASIIAWANQLDMADAAARLEENLSQEKAADESSPASRELAPKRNPPFAAALKQGANPGARRLFE
jgi:hypothetical protein